jgi:shikimate kinase
LAERRAVSAAKVGERRAARPVYLSHAVFLVGFMGAGKTSVGRVLARRLNWLFEDLDDLIEQREGRRIVEIFRDSGEAVFRQAEHRALRQVLNSLSGKPGRVVALGGGAFAQAKNAALLKRHGLHVMFLDAPVEVLWERCQKQASEMGTDRPLLRSTEHFCDLYQARRKSYSKAARTVQTGGREFEEIAAEIAELLELKKLNICTEMGEVE